MLRTACELVRNRVYPLPRETYFTRESVCPRLASKVNGSRPYISAAFIPLPPGSETCDVGTAAVRGLAGTAREPEPVPAATRATTQIAAIAAQRRSGNRRGLMKPRFVYSGGHIHG